jgi:hypothetical protein
MELLWLIVSQIIKFLIITLYKRRGRVVNIPVYYSGGRSFKYRSSERLP